MALTDLIHYLESSLTTLGLVSDSVTINHWFPYALVFLSTVIEGPIATLTAAAIAATGYLNPILVFIFAASGNLTADLGYFLLGRLGRFEMIAWVLRKLHIDSLKIDELKSVLCQNSAKTIFVAKLSNGLIVPMLLSIGTIRIPLRRWMPALMAGEFLWSSTLVLAGYFFSDSIQMIEADSRFLSITLSIILLLGVLFWTQRKIGHRAQGRN